MVNQSEANTPTPMWKLLMFLVLGLTCDLAHGAGFIVVGIDRTEAYEAMTESAVAIALDYVKQADPGDELWLRYISGASYPLDQIITHLNLPQADLPEPSGLYDARGKRQHQLALKQFKRGVYQAKLRSVETLYNQCVGPTRRTDIVGFITAAAEHFATAPEGADKQLVLATDLGENRHYDSLIDLSGVSVRIYQVRGASDPAVVQRARKHWQEVFHLWGAADVLFPMPSLEQLNWDNARCKR